MVFLKLFNNNSEKCSATFREFSGKIKPCFAYRCFIATCFFIWYRNGTDRQLYRQTSDRQTNMFFL